MSFLTPTKPTARMAPPRQLHSRGRRSKAPLRLGAGCAAASALAALCYYAFSEPVVFLMSGANEATRSDVAEALAPFAGQNIFSTDLVSVRKALLQLPGIGEVTFERLWPDQIRILVTRDRPAALLNGTHIVTRYRRVYEISRWRAVSGIPVDTARLPRLSLPPPPAVYDLDEAVSMYTDMSAILAGTGLELAGLDISTAGSLSLESSSGMKIHLCRRDFLARTSRLAAIWRAYLSEVKEQIGTVNLCYPGGLAWRPAAALSEEEPR
ncbi:MAG: FtsQ-type POTRA domain-containing protein [Proteobacteria bacterium]|nr:FtsQ-type POTRA domain-containing protein [Pseudomonadota bacterium]